MKNLTPALQQHLQSGVTTICTCMEIIRRDQKSYHFTDHDDIVRVANVGYVPYASFARTSISTSLDLEVDGMEIKGILNSDFISRDDVAGGVFDFAEVRVFVVNYMDPDGGQAVLRVGWLGEVTMNEDGTFNAELRGLSQVYAYRIGEAYAPECRADLGDRRCKLALAPPRWLPNYAYKRGDTVLGAINPANAYLNLSLVNPSFDDEAAVTLTRDVEGWTTYGDSKGRWTIRQDPWYNTKAQDSYAVYNTDNGDRDTSDLGLYQDVNITEQGVDPYEIDTGLCRLYATFKTACVNGREAGTRVRIYCYDENHVPIGPTTLYDTGLQKTAEDRWFTQTCDNVLIPPGTRILRFDLFAHKRSRYEEGAGFDTVTAAINTPDGDFAGSDQFGDVAFVAMNSGHTGDTEPAWSNLIGGETVDNEITWKAIKLWRVTTYVDGVVSPNKLRPTYVFDADGYYDGGLIRWETGKNAGRAQEVKFWKDGVLTLFQRPYHVPQEGDRFVLHPGCDKRRATCKTKFGNILNFRGEPDVPGQDSYYSGPDAPTS